MNRTILTLNIVWDNSYNSHPATWDWHSLLDCAPDEDVTVVNSVDWSLK